MADALRKYKLIWGIPEESFLKKHAKDKDMLLPEMRPALWGAGLLAKRLKNSTLISDNMIGLFFFKAAIKEVVIFYQDRDSLGYALPTGGLTIIILAKRHGVNIKLLRGNYQQGLKITDRSALTFLGKPVTVQGVLPVLPEIEFADYKLLEANFK